MMPPVWSESEASDEKHGRSWSVSFSERDGLELELGVFDLRRSLDRKLLMLDLDFRGIAWTYGVGGRGKTGVGTNLDSAEDLEKRK